MKKFFVLTGMCLMSLVVFPQAKKPTLMVVPADVYCFNHNYKTEFTTPMGNQEVVDYTKAMRSDNQLRMVITKMGQIMAARDFPLKDLEQTLKSIEQTSAETMLLSSTSSGAGIYETPIDILKRTASADIILDLDFEIKRQGPEQYIVFNLRGLDAYTNKQVAGVAGSGAPSYSANADILLEEAVLSHMDNFVGQLMDHFNDMFENGREMTLTVKVWDNADLYLEDEFDYAGESDELGIFIEDWMADNSVNGRFSTEIATESQMKFTQVRMPMFYERSGRQRAMDARRFGTDLRQFLQDNFQIESKVYTRGLGEVWVILGEK